MSIRTPKLLIFHVRTNVILKNENYGPIILYVNSWHCLFANLLPPNCTHSLKDKVIGKK